MRSGSRPAIGIALAACIAFMPVQVWAAPVLDSAELTWPWCLPFVGLLLSIATGPLVSARIWARYYGKIAAGWSALTLAAIGAAFGPPTAFHALLHAMLADYVSFIALLFSLYVVAGGIVVSGNFHGTPAGNAGMLLLGTMLASFVGTAGAAMIMVRPLIRANHGRRHNAHVLMFAIILIANVGGSLTPLGNPPLFVGFLHGVDLFWPAQHLLAPVSLLTGLILAIFLGIDIWCYRQEHPDVIVRHKTQTTVIRIRGVINFYLVGGIVAAILMSAAWRPDVVIHVGSVGIELQNFLRDAIITLLAFVSLALTPSEHREANGFTWEPIREVAKLFAGIFVCIIPVLAMLDAGPRGSFAWMLALTAKGGESHSLAYFWLSGVLSSVLDNAPTYLMFFEFAGGDAQRLMGPLADTLAAISLGASTLGALTYVGNAPNLMIYAMAVERGIAMPSFFAFTAWSGAVLLPPFALVGWLYFGSATL
jgi:Na+/H+ antiporter NhaD/arsenite permease-like protein